MFNVKVQKHFSSDDIVALLIDFDNVPKGLVECVVQSAVSKCKHLACMAYADWDKSCHQDMKKVLQYLGHETVSLPEGVNGKNAADMLMTIDGVDFLHTARFDTYCIVSSDYDFAPLARRIYKSGIKAVGFGERKSKLTLRNRFTSYGVLEKQEYLPFKGVLKREAARRAVNEDENLTSSVLKSIESLSREGKCGVSLSSVVSTLKSEYGGISPKDYFCKNWHELFLMAEYCEVTSGENNRVIRCCP